MFYAVDSKQTSQQCIECWKLTSVNMGELTWLAPCYKYCNTILNNWRNVLEVKKRVEKCMLRFGRHILYNDDNALWSAFLVGDPVRISYWWWQAFSGLVFCHLLVARKDKSPAFGNIWASWCFFDKIFHSHQPAHFVWYYLLNTQSNIDGLRKFSVTPLLTHWSYCSLALYHRYIVCSLKNAYCFVLLCLVVITLLSLKGFY